MSYFRVHPAINIARVGTSKEYYIAPETAAGEVVDPGTGLFGGLPIKAGTEDTPIQEADLRDAEQNPKRQAARFHIYAYDSPQDQYPGKDKGREIKDGDRVGGKTVKDITWTVHLANKKNNNYAITAQEHRVVDGKYVQTGVEPGDLCKYMSQPWHTDYNSCATHTPDPNPVGNNTLYWSWPAQRPVNVYPKSGCSYDAASATWNLGGQVFSVRGNEGHGTATPYPQQQGRYQCYFDFVENWHKVGFVIQGLQVPADQGGDYGADKFVEVSSFHDGQKLQWEQADFVIDASGIGAAFARRIGIARNLVDEVIALCALLPAMTQTRPAHTLIQAVEKGWWYAGRLPGDRAIVSLATDTETSKASALATPKAWHRALQETRWFSGQCRHHFGTDIPRPAAIHPKPMPSAILSAVVGEDWLAVGDAASSYDAMSSAGITKALMHGQIAGRALATYPRDADTSALAAYQDRVFQDFNTYLGLHQQHYRAERRFPHSRFWQRRRLDFLSQKVPFSTPPVP